MNIEWTFIPADISGPVRWIPQDAGDPALAMIKVTSRQPAIPFRFETGLVRIAIGAGEIAGGEGLAVAAGKDATGQSLPSPPNWDMTIDNKISRFAVEKFGGATTAIGVHDGAKDLDLSPSDLESYTLPRLVRSNVAPAPNALTAVSIDNTLLYFDLDAAQITGRRVGKAQAGQIWHMPKAEIVLLDVPADARVSRLGQNPGTLWLQIRDKLFTPVEGMALAEGKHTYQFDCTVAGDDAYVLLVTDHGPGLGRVSVSGKKQPEYSWFQIAGSVASSPSLFAANGALWLALIEHEDLWPIGVRVGRLALQ